MSLKKLIKKTSIEIFIGLSKAFDTLNHEILFNTLNLYGVCGTVNNWFRSYLENRFQFVQIDSIKSKILLISCGFPQGSILSPLLFILYINDIVNISELAEVLKFADDTNLFFSLAKKI